MNRNEKLGGIVATIAGLMGIIGHFLDISDLVF